jgi:hypothetical protein
MNHTFQLLHTPIHWIPQDTSNSSFRNSKTKKKKKLTGSDLSSGEGGMWLGYRARNQLSSLHYSAVLFSYFNFGVINSMEQSPSSEANSHSLSQEIPRLLQNMLVHYRVHNSPVLGQMNSVHTHSNIILPSTPSSYEMSLPFRISDQYFVRISYLWKVCYVPRPSEPPWYDHPTLYTVSLWNVLEIIKLKSWVVFEKK